MVIYNLEETLEVFITPNYYDNEFVYRMEHIDREDSRKTIRSIDLRNDKLVIYGTEVKESMFKRLYESLVLRPKVGIIYVNCDGACYFYASGKLHRPIHNVLFDWFSFGVIVPNSVNDSLRKKVEELEKVVENSSKEVELAKIEVESSKVSLKASNDEVNELKIAQNEMGLKMQKVYEKVALVDFEVELYKIELESYKKELDEVLDELCNCKIEKEKMEVELHKTRDQLLFEISSLEERNRELEMKSKMLEAQFSSVNIELKLTKDQRELFAKNMKELDDRLLSLTNEYQDVKDDFKKVQNQLMTNKEVQYTMEVELQKLRDRLSSEISLKNKISYEMALESKISEDKLSLVQSELDSIKDQRGSLEQNWKELTESLLSCENRNQGMKEELEKVQDLLSMANKELKDQIKCYKKEKQCMEIELQNMKCQIRSINLEVKVSHQKLDQVLISSLWKNCNCSHCNVADMYREFGFSSLEIIAHEIQIQ